MESYDDDLSQFDAEGAAPLPDTNDQGYAENEGARIWYATYGSGGMERWRMYCIDPCFEHSHTRGGCVFLCLQHGSEWHKGI